jgi:hypothetical protein
MPVIQSSTFLDVISQADTIVDVDAAKCVGAWLIIPASSIMLEAGDNKFYDHHA